MQRDMTVIYNDTCPICSREVAAYKRRTPDAVRYVGLDPDRLAQLGLTPDAAARRFHVVRDGTLLSGVPAFAALWDTMPRLRWLARLVRLPGIRGVTAWGYDRVAAPLLYALHRRRQARAD